MVCLLDGTLSPKRMLSVFGAGGRGSQGGNQHKKNTWPNCGNMMCHGVLVYRACLFLPSTEKAPSRIRMDTVFSSMTPWPPTGLERHQCAISVLVAIG